MAALAVRTRAYPVVQFCSSRFRPRTAAFIGFARFAGHRYGSSHSSVQPGKPFAHPAVCGCGRVRARGINASGLLHTQTTSETYGNDEEGARFGISQKIFDQAKSPVSAPPSAIRPPRAGRGEPNCERAPIVIVELCETPHSCALSRRTAASCTVVVVVDFLTLSRAEDPGATNREAGRS